MKIWNSCTLLLKGARTHQLRLLMGLALLLALLGSMIVGLGGSVAHAAGTANA